MGAFTDPNFVKEFSYRTKINYYTMLRDHSDNLIDRERAKDKIEIIKKEMLDRQYGVSGYYDVTQLINSLIGLLVFPEQMYFDCLSGDPRRLSMDFPVLNSLINKESYCCTYKQNYYNSSFEKCPSEKKSPVKVLNHLRNSVSHKHLMIRPLNSRFDKSNIESIVFEDACLYEWNGQKWIPSFHDDSFREYSGCSYLNFRPEAGKKIAVFHLEVPVEDLEPILMEICDFFVLRN